MPQPRAANSWHGRQRDAGPDGRPITTDDLPALPWTAAVIDEATRLLATMVQQVRLVPLTTSAVAEPLVTLRPRGGMPTLVERC